ncbi:MAG: ribbon-helix-helix domain-containing protein [Pseudomonadota bacterium]
MGKKIATTVYITEDQQARLKALNEQTKVPVAEYIRQGIDVVLDQNAHQIPGQLDLPLMPPEALANNLPNLNKK